MARPWRVLAILTLLALIGFGLFLAGTNAWAWYNYRAADKAIAEGDYEQAEKHLDRCLEFWPRDSQAHFRMARVARCLGHYDQAREHLDRCQELGWSSDGVEVERTLLLAEQGEFARLEELLVEWAEKDIPDTAPVLEVLAKHYFQNSQLKLALRWGKRFVKHSPHHIRSLMNLGRICEMMGNSADALRYYREAVEVGPDNDLARQALADALLHFKEAGDALEQYQALRDRQPNSRAVLLGLARCHRALGQLTECRRLLERLKDSHPRDWEVLAELGMCARQQHRWAEAEKWLRRSVDLFPYELSTLYALYFCLKQQGAAKLEQADKCYSRYNKLKDDLKRLQALSQDGVARNPRNPDLHVEIGLLCLRCGQEQSGVYWLQKALEINPRHRGAHKAMAEYYDKHGEKELADKHRGWMRGEIPTPLSP